MAREKPADGTARLLRAGRVCACYDPAMSEPIGFRQDVVNAYIALVPTYLARMELCESFATAAGAWRYLAAWVAKSDRPPLSEAEERAIRLTVAGEIGRDNRTRGGQKRVESVKVAGKEGSRVTFEVTYSDMEIVHAHAFREHALRRDNPWSRGDGWPDVPFDFAATAERWGSWVRA